MTTPNTLPCFRHIGPRTSLYTPKPPASGQLIILCTWLGAGQKHIAKYTSLYQRIAPESRILLIESSVSNIIGSYAVQRRESHSAVLTVTEVLSEGAQLPLKTEEAINSKDDKRAQSGGPIVGGSNHTEPKILLHTFSNGGTSNATHLLMLLRERLQSPLPLTGLICDSGPAKGTYWRSHDALVLSMPKHPLTRFFGAIIAHCSMMYLKIWIAMGNESPATLNRHVMLDREHVSGPHQSGADGPADYVYGRRVCYLYSRADQMCQWTDVAEHAEEARQKVWSVNEVVFEDSGHCAPLLLHLVTYTQAVKEMWTEGAEKEV